MGWLPYLTAVLGLCGGFALGLAVLSYVTRGLDKQDLLEIKETKTWLGLLGWSFAILGGWLGYQLGTYLLYAYR